MAQQTFDAPSIVVQLAPRMIGVQDLGLTSGFGPQSRAYINPAFHAPTVRTTHEVRIPRPVHVHRSAHLQAVFAPRARVTADPDIEALFAWCRTEQVDTVGFDASRGNDFETLKRECLGYIRQELH